MTDDLPIVTRLNDYADPMLENDKQATLREAAALIREMHTALEFYRDGFSYHPKRSKTGVNLSEWRPKEELLNDCGNRAMTALSRAKGEK